MSKTLDALKDAFAGESQANRRYLAFAEKADKDGFPQVAKLFRAAAYAETVHAMNHFKAMGGIEETAENLKTAIAGENYEVASMYPEFIKYAEDEAEKRALRSFNWAYEVEKVHEALYRSALEHLGEEKAETDYYVCPFCGFTHEGPLDGKCPVCGTPRERFVKIN